MGRDGAGGEEVRARLPEHDNRRLTLMFTATSKVPPPPTHTQSTPTRERRGARGKGQEHTGTDLLLSRDGGAWAGQGRAGGKDPGAGQGRGQGHRGRGRVQARAGGDGPGLSLVLVGFGLGKLDHREAGQPEALQKEVDLGGLAGTGPAQQQYNLQRGRGGHVCERSGGGQIFGQSIKNCCSGAFLVVIGEY